MDDTSHAAQQDLVAEAEAVSALRSMTKSELADEAEARGLDVKPGATKAELLELLGVPGDA